ncbi:MAG TPA: hypothetical protein VIN08_18410 [Ohtaekwangia sp.]|uniref:hypothetical protein n=1 Tax=Ohtaekwangia sp. TaxID=2066019 RepID=UPI002F955B8C
MNFFHHSSTWIKGELLEAILIASFGILTMVSGFLFWKLGTTPNSKALLIPLSVTGIIYSAIGVSMLVSNNKRLVSFEKSYRQDERAFVLSEQKRVEGFQYGYTISKIVASVFFPLTLLLFWWSKSPQVQGWGIGLALFALAGLVVDYFSQERADTYYRAILEVLRMN